MSAITNVQALYAENAGQKTLLYRARGVNSGDTIDLSTVGSPTLVKVEAATFISSAQGAAVVGVVSGNTVVTLTSTGMTLDTVDILVKGV